MDIPDLSPLNEELDDPDGPDSELGELDAFEREMSELFPTLDHAFGPDMTAEVAATMVLNLDGGAEEARRRLPPYHPLIQALDRTEAGEADEDI